MQEANVNKAISSRKVIFFARNRVTVVPHPDKKIMFGEKAGDESEGTDTERDTPEGEEEENIQREEQPEEQQVDPCGSPTALLGL